jgi:hypothetical protein
VPNVGIAERSYGEWLQGAPWLSHLAADAKTSYGSLGWFPRPARPGLDGLRLTKVLSPTTPPPELDGGILGPIWTMPSGSEQPMEHGGYVETTLYGAQTKGVNRL